MSKVTTQILDLATGMPARDLHVQLAYKSFAVGWQVIGEGVSDADGRVNNLLSPDHILEPGHYRLIFDTGPYFLSTENEGFFSQVTISFVVKDITQRYHVPLLLSPFGYTTYRGSCLYADPHTSR